MTTKEKELDLKTRIELYFAEIDPYGYINDHEIDIKDINIKAKEFASVTSLSDEIMWLENLLNEDEEKDEKGLALLNEAKYLNYFINGEKDIKCSSVNLGITVAQLYDFCSNEIKKGNGNKHILITDDDEGNGLHTLFCSFTEISESWLELEHDGTHTINNSIILG